LLKRQALNLLDSLATNPAQIVRGIAIAFTLLAALISIKAFLSKGTFPLKMFSVACFLSVTGEMMGFLFKSKTQEVVALGGSEFDSNHWVYNIYHYFYFMLMGFVYYHQLKGDLMRAAIQMFRIAFTVFFLFNSFFWQGIGTYQTFTVVVGGSFMIILAAAYFWELLVSPENERITKDPFFWFSFGLIVFYGGTIPFLGMLNYLAVRFYDFTVFYQLYIFNGFSIFLNSLILVGFLCSKTFQK
jgi:hypothetical protein